MGEEYSIINRGMLEGSFKRGGKTRMMPIQKLLDRIRWDREFGRGHFEIGYDDHMEQEILRIPLRKIKFRDGDHFSFQIEDAAGELHTIPFHRIREVYKEGRLIWQRPASRPT